MSECTCHKNYTLDTLIPKVGVITDIREETPDVKTFRVNAPEGGKLFEHMPGQCAMLCAAWRKRGNVFHHFLTDKQGVSGVQYQKVRQSDRATCTAWRWAMRSPSAGLTATISR